MPGPPRLPKEEQEIFENLQKQSTGAFSTPRTQRSDEPAAQANEQATVSASGEEPKHRDYHGQLRPEFEGEKNPETGEIGGPKNNPLRWGSEGDWSYGGRVTDF